ncbi:MAG: polynucleotide adenylyltransferase, partial [Acidobacteria bacterium]
MGPVVPSGVRRLLGVLRDAGGRPYLVGGAVRDSILGLPHKDLDIEVFSLALGPLKEALASVGRVDAVGEAFTVFKVSGLEGVEGAVMFDPFAEALVDPFGGQRDLAERVLRAVDPAAFGEDPLRALRAVQLAARFELRVEPRTAALCASMPLGELPADRIFGEMQKLLLKARRPSIGMALLREWGLLPAVAP